MSFLQLYRGVEPSDVPFAEDCMGDRFLLRDAGVIRLAAETGDFEQTGLSLVAFLERAQRAPLEFLQMHPLVQFQREGKVLRAGQLLAAYGDVVRATPDSPELKPEIRKVVRRSGHQTILRGTRAGEFR